MPCSNNDITTSKKSCRFSYKKLSRIVTLLCLPFYRAKISSPAVAFHVPKWEYSIGILRWLPIRSLGYSHPNQRNITSWPCCQVWSRANGHPQHQQSFPPWQLGPVCWKANCNLSWTAECGIFCQFGLRGQRFGLEDGESAHRIKRGHCSRSCLSWSCD